MCLISNLELGPFANQIGNTVLHTFEIVSRDAGACSALLAGGTQNGPQFSTIGTHEYAVFADSNLTGAGVQANGSFIGTVRLTSTSLREADGYGTAQNISSSDFYILNDAGTIWLNQSGGSDLDIA